MAFAHLMAPESSTPLCPSCGADRPLTFCAHCGERRTGRLSWHALRHDAIEHLLHFDSPLLHTMRAMTLGPGTAVRQFLQGARKPYADPVRYVLIVATALLIAWHFVDSGAEPTSEVARQQAHIFRTILSFYGYYLFAVALPIAALQSLFFRRQQWRVVECYVFGLYVFGHMLWLSVLTAPLAVQPGGPVGLAIYAIQFGFLTAAVRGFYQTSLLKALGAAVVLFVSYVVALAGAGIATFGFLSLVGRL